MKKLFLISLTAILLFALALSVCSGSNPSTKPVPPADSLITGVWASADNIKPAVTLKIAKLANSGQSQIFGGTYFTYQGEIACSVLKNGKVAINGELPKSLSSTYIIVSYNPNAKIWNLFVQAHDSDYDAAGIVDDSCIIMGSIMNGQIVGRVAIHSKNSSTNIYDTQDIINNPDRLVK